MILNDAGLRTEGQAEGGVLNFRIRRAAVREKTMNSRFGAFWWGNIFRGFRPPFSKAFNTKSIRDIVWWVRSEIIADIPTP
jgi:hypothetical protein